MSVLLVAVHYICPLIDFSFVVFVFSASLYRTMAGPVAQEEQKFSLQEVLATFKLCLSENKEVYLEHYVAGWRGLIK